MEFTSTLCKAGMGYKAKIGQALQAVRQKKAGLNTINQKDDEWIFENALHQFINRACQ